MVSAELYLRTVTTSKGVPGGAPVENGGGKPRSNLALTAASRLPFTAGVEGHSVAHSPDRVDRRIDGPNHTDLRLDRSFMDQQAMSFNGVAEDLVPR